jgi:transposase
MKQISVIGLDLAKQSFQVHGAAADGTVAFNRKLRRGEVLRFFEKTPPCLVAMEACGGSHYWAREIMAFGHDVRLIPPVYVKPFVKRGKTDAADAEAISEAASRKTMRFVPIKSAEQQASAMILKVRALLVRQQTQAINALRAHLSELGLVAAGGMAKVAALIEIVRDESDRRLPISLKKSSRERLRTPKRSFSFEIAATGRSVRRRDGRPARGLCRDWLHLPGHRAQFGEPSQVLGGRRQKEFILGSGWAAQPQTVEPEDALEVGE